jgi:formylglycine-generating enzyme required for sulfatase activity
MPVTSAHSPEHRWVYCNHSVSLGDLLRLLHLGIPREEACKLTGFIPVEVKEQAEYQERKRGVQRLKPPPGPKGETQESQQEQHAPPLWRAIGPKLREPDPADRQRPRCLEEVKPQSGSALAARSHKMISPPPLMPPSRLSSVLFRMLTVKAPGALVDDTKLVRRMANLLPLLRLPRKSRRVWTARLQVYWDQHQTLGPCWHDQLAVAQWLRRWRGLDGLELIVVTDDGKAQWHPNHRPGQRPSDPREVRAPDNGTTILALSDLGFAFTDQKRQDAWAGLKRRANRVGAPCLALVLCPRRCWQHLLAKAWQAKEWERSRALADVSEQDTPPLEKLFVLLSPAIRIESGLLRAVRRLLPGGRADLGIELEAWMDPRVAWRGAPLGMVLAPRQTHLWRKKFRELPDQQRAAVVALLEHFHGELAPNILAEERLACGVRVEESLQQLAAHARGLVEGKARYDTLSGAETAYLQRLEARQAPEDWQQAPLAALWAVAHRTREGFAKPLPDGLEMHQVLWALEDLAEPGWWLLYQRGTSLQLVQKTGEGPVPGSPLAEFRLRLPQVALRWRDPSGKQQKEELRAGASIEAPLAPEPAGVARVTVSGDLGDAEIILADKPAWADRFWRDERGLWVATKVRGFEWKVEESKGWLFKGKPKLSIVPQDLDTKLLWPTWAKRLERDESGLFAEVELDDKVVTRLRWIPPGRFLMGSPEDEKGRYDNELQHWVTLTKGYWLADAPCTQAEWLAVMGTEPSNFKGPNLPVEQVSWEECQAFCEKLQLRFPGLQARLPSEAEWEYACRAGTASAFNDGSSCTEPEGKDPTLDKLGWFDQNSGGQTHDVREKKPPNQWGLHDMHGNVWEWCADGYSEYTADEQVDPTGADTGHGRVLRGGSWGNWARNCRSAGRLGGRPDDRFHYLGFRLASGQSEQVSQASTERAAGKQAGRRPDAAGGERPGKKGRK